MSAPTIVRRPQPLATTRVPTRAAGCVVVAVASLAAAVPWALSESWWVEAGLVSVLLTATTAVLTDMAGGRIPDRVVLASIVPTVVVLGLQIGAGVGRAAGISIALGAVAFALPLLVVHLVAPAALGFGDVKLASALGAALGLVEWRYSVGALCLASGLTGFVALVRRRPTAPFAPGLVLGAALVLLLPILEGSLPWP